MLDLASTLSWELQVEACSNFQTTQLERMCTIIYFSTSGCHETHIPHGSSHLPCRYLLDSFVLKTLRSFYLVVQGQMVIDALRCTEMLLLAFFKNGGERYRPLTAASKWPQRTASSSHNRPASIFSKKLLFGAVQSA